LQPQHRTTTTTATPPISPPSLDTVITPTNTLSLAQLLRRPSI
jgi:hypothetical protein